MFLARYLHDLSGVAALARLDSLSGEWDSLGGAELTTWWNRLSEVRAGELQSYIDGLWEVMSGRGFDHVFESRGWAEPPKPLPEQKVKVYSLRLWFGARLDMLAYQSPRDPGRLVVVLYGTVEDMKEWYGGVARLAVFNGLIPAWGGEATNLLWGFYGIGFGYWHRTSVGYGFAMNLQWATSYLEHVDARAELAVWKVRVGGGSGTLKAGGWTLEPEVYWVLVEPLLAELYVATAEQLYRLVVGAPVFQLTANMVLGPHAGYLRYALWVRDVVHEMLPLNYDMKHPAHSPASVLLKGGVCVGYALASAMIANLAGGLPVALIAGVVPIPGFSNPSHAISAIVVPSRTGVADEIRLHFDVDGDGLNETAIVLYDTAGLNRRELEVMTQEELLEEIVVPPYRFAVGIRSGDMMAMAGLMGYADALGKPFTATPVEEARRIVKPEIPWMSYKEHWGVAPGPEKVMSPDATTTYTEAHYIWKVRKEDFPFRIPDDATPEWFLHNVIIPSRVDSDWLHAKGGGANEYFTATPSFVQELYRLFLERFWGIPEGYRPLPPPTAPISVPPPPPLPDFS